MTGNMTAISDIWTSAQMSHRAVMIRTEMKKKPTCPSCAATDLVPIVYGYPDSELFEAADRGEVDRRLRGLRQRPEVGAACAARILADGTAAVSEAV